MNAKNTLVLRDTIRMRLEDAADILDIDSNSEEKKELYDLARALSCCPKIASGGKTINEKMTRCLDNLRNGRREDFKNELLSIKELVSGRKEGGSAMNPTGMKKSKHVKELEEQLEQCKAELECTYEDIRKYTDEEARYTQRFGELPEDDSQLLELAYNIEKCEKNREKAKDRIQELIQNMDTTENAIACLTESERRHKPILSAETIRKTVEEADIAERTRKKMFEKTRDALRGTRQVKKSAFSKESQAMLAKAKAKANEQKANEEAQKDRNIVAAAFERANAVEKEM